MKKIAIIASTVAGLATLGLGHLYLSRLEAEVSGGPKVPILVASRDIPVGATLSDRWIGVREVPRAYVEQRHIKKSDLDEVEDARVSAGLRANDAILWSDLAEFSDKARVLSGLVPQGMRAVALDGRDVDFGGLLRPGDRVDVLLTIVGDGDNQNSTRTLLQNLLVLSVGENIAGPGKETTARRSRGTVTVSATVEGAQILAQGRRRGQLSLSLRNPDDVAVVEELPKTTAQSLTEGETSGSATTGTTRARSGGRSKHRGVERVR